MRIDNVAICDDIRKEDTGKFILIGVYTDDILFSELPGEVNLSLWVEIHAEKKGTTPIEIRVLENEKTIVRIKGQINIVDIEKSVSLRLSSVSIKIQDECVLSFQIREQGKKWRTLKKLSAGLLEK